ncbi:MAG TPA: heavy metal-binding domain-containing protein [Ignavibacteriaceae bacterium]|nr:heavy metal-binding domain-containing protein [Ignavibacteriaceae bacterium]
MIEKIMDKIIYFAFVFVVINISITAKVTDSGNPPYFLNNKTELSADSIYSCTMHPDVKSLEPGKCPKCGMDLIPFEYTKTDSTKSSDEDYYTCSMHPEVQSDKPGNCPKCGMELVKKSEASTSNHGMMGMMMDSPWMIGVGIIMVVVMAIHFIK